MRTVGQSFALLTRLCFDGGTASSNGCRRIETNCRRERLYAKLLAIGGEKLDSRKGAADGLLLNSGLPLRVERSSAAPQ